MSLQAQAGALATQGSHQLFHSSKSSRDKFSFLLALACPCWPLFSQFPLSHNPEAILRLQPESALGSEGFLVAMVTREVLLLPELHWNKEKESNMFVNRQQAPPPQLSRLIRLGADSWERALVTFQFAIRKWGANYSACLLHLNPDPSSCYRNWFW